jgi:mycothiol synthase
VLRTLRRFTAADVDLIRALADSVARATAIEPLNDATWEGIRRDDGRDVGFLDSRTDGSSAAYAHLARHGDGWSLELAERPGEDFDPRPLVDAALDEALARGGGHVTLWSHGDDPQLDEIATKTGFVVERELLQLRVPLPLAEGVPRIPDGVTIRPFEPGRDELGWVAVNNRAFSSHAEQGSWTVDGLLAREEEPWFDTDGFLLAHDHQGLAGFCWTKLHAARPPVEPDVLGEIYVIGVDPDRQGIGLGRYLTASGLASLHARGASVGMLFVDADNTAARALYESMGFRSHRSDRAYGQRLSAGP